jgi:hypothetical protein
MIARRFEDLIAWQLAFQLEQEAFAHGSLDETKNHLHAGHRKNYLTDARYQDLLRLNYRALKANTRLLLYLKSCNPDDWL